MKKAILISIRPEWVEKILNGEKTIEIRKTAPKCELPIDVYIYCTEPHAKEVLSLFVPDARPYFGGRAAEFIKRKFVDEPGMRWSICNGKVVAKFALLRIERFGMAYPYEEPTSLFLKKACVTIGQARTYASGKYPYYNPLCAWRIYNLEIFDEPKKLSDFGLKRAPQSWQYVEVEE